MHAPNAIRFDKELCSTSKLARAWCLHLEHSLKRENFQPSKHIWVYYQRHESSSSQLNITLSKTFCAGEGDFFFSSADTIRAQTMLLTEFFSFYLLYMTIPQVALKTTK